MKDYQRKKVYDWERKYVPEGKNFEFSEIQEYVNYVWKEMGLINPPKVYPMHKNDNNSGKASRTRVYFPERNSTQHTILHELAHSMTASAVDGISHQHNEYYVGMFMILLEKFMNMNPIMLWWSADKEGVKFVRNAKPSITDDGVFFQ